MSPSEAPGFVPLSAPSQSLLDSLLGRASFGVALFDHALRYLWINDTLARQNGRAPDWHVGKGFTEVFPEQEGSFDVVLARARDEQASQEVDIEGPVPGRAGEHGNALVDVHPIAWGDGANGVGVIVVDSTERVRAERDLDESLRQLAALGERQRYALDALQHGFLPRTLPEVPDGVFSARYSAAADLIRVGGDWYDAFVTDRAVYLCVGDVAGHGLDAVEVMAQLRHASRAWFFDQHEPHTVLSRLDALTATTYPGMFATAVIAQFDRTTMCLRVAVAGHPPPFIARRNGTVDLLTLAPGPPLGAFPGARYQSLDYPVSGGDTVFLYTDGLIERRGESLDTGLRRLHDALGPRAGLSLEQLVDQVQDELFADSPRNDDMCILAYRPTRPTPTTH